MVKLTHIYVCRPIVDTLLTGKGGGLLCEPSMPPMEYKHIDEMPTCKKCTAKVLNQPQQRQA